MRMFGLGRIGSLSPLNKDELWLALVLLVAVLFFLGGTTFIERRMGRLTETSRSVSAATLPSVVEVCHVEHDMQELEATLGGPSSPEVAAHASATMDRIESRWRRERDISNEDRERALWGRVGEDLSKLRIEILHLLEAGASIESQQLRTAISSDALAADVTLGSVVEFEQDQAGQLFADAEQTRIRTRGIAYGLDGLSIMIVVALAVQAIRAHRTHRRALEARLDELQIFAVRLAHDIRGPLMPAMLALERMGKGVAPEHPAATLIERGVRSLRTIERLVEALLAFASAGTAPSRVESARADEVVDAVVSQNLDAAVEGGVDLKLECPRGLRVACSEGVLASILGNLVGNALKHMGDRKDRRVAVRACAKKGRVRIEVQDSGVGLPEGAANRIFDPFVRVDARTKGLGLGLATAKRLVVAHGGTIGVEAAKPCGCLFWIDLPEAPGSLADTAASTARRDRAD
jgi:signal transduction histidine kinase